jgi:hypothetical protein
MSRRTLLALGIVAAVAVASSMVMAAALYGQTQVNTVSTSGFSGNGVADPNLPNTPTLTLVQAPADLPACDGAPNYGPVTYTAGQATTLAISAIGDDDSGCPASSYPVFLWTITPAATLSAETIFLNYTSHYSDTGAVFANGGGSITLSFTAGANAATEPILLYIVFGNVGNGGSIQTLNLTWT